MWPLVITSGGKWQVLTVATAGLQSRYNAQWTLVMAATTVAIVPLIVLFVAFAAPHRALDRGDGAQMTSAAEVLHARRRRRWRSIDGRCCSSPRCCWADPANPRGRTVVTVRLWDEQVAAAYRESFDAVHRRAPRHRCTGQRGLVRHLLRHVAHRCGRRQRRRHLLAVQRILRRLRRQRPADGHRESIGAERRSGLGAVGGRPVHPQRCAAGRCRS